MVGRRSNGNWTQNTNPALAVFTPSITSGSFIATLTVTGTATAAELLSQQAEPFHGARVRQLKPELISQGVI